MSTITEIQGAIEHLPAKERRALAAWLSSQDGISIPAPEEKALLACLDQAAAELDAGRGTSADEVRNQVRQWAGK